MKITAVRPILLSAPYAAADDDERRFHLRTGYRTASLIKVETSEGLYGLGETYAGVYAPEAVAALVSQLGDELTGADALQPVTAWHRMHLASRYWGRVGLSQSVIGGIEMALWDLKGKVFGQPVHGLLGGDLHPTIPVYASGGNNKPIADLQAEMRQYVELGFEAIKIRINNLPDVDAIEQKVATCHQSVAGQARLAVDAAQGLAKYPWTAKQAVEVAERLLPFDLLWLEEPTAVDKYDEFSRVRRESRIPIAGGETVTSELEAAAYLSADALDLFQPDAALIGGISVLKRVADMCQQRGVPIAVHAWSSAVGMMGNYHAGFACPNCRFLEMPCVANPLRDRLLVEPLQIENGALKRPQTSGLGVHLPEGIEDEFPFRRGSHYKVLGFEDRKEQP